MGVDREGRLDGDRQTGRLKEGRLDEGRLREGRLDGGRPEEGRLGGHTDGRLGGTEREMRTD